MAKKSAIKNTLKREVLGAILERSQRIDLNSLDSFKPTSMKESNVKYDNINEKLNIPYVNREEIPLAMDLFKPKGLDNTELPVIVLIHGGGLTMGDRTISRPLGRKLASKGYLVFSIEYRLVPKANFAQELDDVCAGLDIVGTELVKHNVDFNRIYLIAESAGAFLALYVTAMHGSQKLQDAIGYKASRFDFKAIGLNCGMFYSNLDDPNGMLLSDQIYGSKCFDEEFLQYMNPEHPEIIHNIPPVFLSTCSGDFLNNYSFMLHEALDKAGKVNRFKYINDDVLTHAFISLQVNHPKTDKLLTEMLEWFDEQSKQDKKRLKKKDTILKKYKEFEKKIESGAIDNQYVYSYIKERRSLSKRELRKTAIIDGAREYTYQEMFEEWDNYARVFTALNITDKNKSRVAICGAITAEPIFAFYGLNTTGVTVSMFSYPDFLPTGSWKTMIKKEKITDLIISDIMVSPQLWEEFMKEKKNLGLRNIILIHSKMGGPCVGPAELIFNECNYHSLKSVKGSVFMEDLIEEYCDNEIYKAKYSKGRIAIITHTSGTTKGTRKPLPYTNESLNISASKLKNEFKKMCNKSDNDSVRTLVHFDFSSLASFSGLVNSQFATGETSVLTFFGFLHPKFVKAFDYYKINFVNTSSFMVDKWIEDDADFDLSTVSALAIGGSYLPPDKIRKYNEYFRKHGYKSSIVRGYGMSECGNAQLTVPAGNDEDILGYPDNIENYYVQDENDNKFYKFNEGERTGIMYITSDTMCENKLDGKVLFEFTKIKGRNFVCTNDMVRVNKDGSVSYAGRTDRFFVNNEGIRFDAGLVEAQITAHPSVNKCALVPVLEKRIHDTVPVIYLILENKKANVEKEVTKILTDVYIKNKKVSDEHIPTQFVIVNSIPCNSNGKVDIYRITRDRLAGKVYNIIPIRKNKKLVEIKVAKEDKANSIKAGVLPEGMGQSSAFNVFDIFNSNPSESKTLKIFGKEINPKKIKKYTKEHKIDFDKILKEFENNEKLNKTLSDFMDVAINKFMKISGKAYKIKNYDYDIEEENGVNENE